MFIKLLKNSILFGLLIVTSCKNQNTFNIEDYYLNENIFKIDTIYQNVQINEKSFKIKILRDKLDEKLEFDEVSPKTVIFYSNETGEIEYVKKIDISKLFFLKVNKNLSEDGKLYLHYVSSFGGSGYSSKTSLVYLENGEIVIKEIFQSSEIDFVFFNKNDKEIYILKGIWNNKLDPDGKLIETHFSNHKYKILQYLNEDSDFEENEIGITKNKYSSLEEGKSPINVLSEIIKNEKIIQINTIATEYMAFDNFFGVFTVH